MNRFLLVVVAVLALAGRNADADMIKLKDGTVLEGTIRSEDNDNVVIEVAFDARGSIKSTRQVARADIAELKHEKPDDKAWAQLQKLQLDPQSSYELEFYDQVINRQFKVFLARWPKSAHTGEVARALAAWEEERANVAIGMVKQGGEWVATNAPPAGATAEVAAGTEEPGAGTNAAASGASTSGRRRSSTVGSSTTTTVPGADFEAELKPTASKSFLVVMLLVLGALLGAAGQIWLLVAAFKVGVGWGLAVLFLPGAQIVFALLHWAEAKVPLLLIVLGVVMVAGGIAIPALAVARSLKEMPAEPAAPTRTVTRSHTALDEPAASTSTEPASATPRGPAGPVAGPGPAPGPGATPPRMPPGMPMPPGMMPPGMMPPGPGPSTPTAPGTTPMPGMPQPPTLTPPGPAVPPRPAIDVDKLRAQLTADYDKRLPLWKTGAEIVVYRRGIGVKGSLVQVAAGNVVLSQEAGQLEIPLAELDNNSQFRLDAAYRTAAIEQTIKQRLAAAATAPAPPR